MKTKNVFSFFSLFVAALIIIGGCTKEGPAGTNGTAGTNGQDGNVVSAADQAAYNAADGSNGGQMYDKFWASTTTFTAPVDANVIIDSITAHSNYFRCKQCHGWDLVGNTGAYIDRAPNATRPNVAPNNLRAFAATHNVREIFDAVKHVGGRGAAKVGGITISLDDNMPDYSLILTDAQVWDIVKFLKADAFNTYNLYDLVTNGTYPIGVKSFLNIGKNGNAAAGNTYYTANCSSCHGTDGTSIALGSLYVGDFFRSKAYEAQHKIRFGQPGSTMNASTATETDIKDLFVAGQDTIAYPSF